MVMGNLDGRVDDGLLCKPVMMADTILDVSTRVFSVVSGYKGKGGGGYVAKKFV